MTRSRPVTTLAVGAVACAALAASTGTALATDAPPGSPSSSPSSSQGPKVRVLDQTVAAPFQLGYAHRRLLVADGAKATVSKLTRKGLKKLFTTPEGLGALGVNAEGDIAYGIQQGGGPAGATTKGALVIKFKHGGQRTVDLLAYDQKENPDGKIRYGIDNPTPCQEKALEELGGASYTGTVDSHPYAVAPLGDHAWVVADAGGNDLLKVTDEGHVSTIAVLPRQPVKITAAGAKALGVPDCVIGAVYNFEPVPTDVEPLGYGFLTTLLPGGPEDPSLGARGSVHFVSWNGETSTIATGFLGATNLAVDNHGDIYVSELFGGKVSRIRQGRVSTYVKLPNALSLEWADGTLYAGTLAPSDEEGNPTGPGTIVAIR